MSDGIIRIGNKGLKTFAFGMEGTPGSKPFEIDVVATIQQWFNIHDEFVDAGEEDEDGKKRISRAEIPRYQQEAVAFVEGLRNSECDQRGEPGYRPVTVAQAFDFNARLREEYDKLVVFFRPKSSEEQDSQDTSGVELQFSEEPQDKS